MGKVNIALVPITEPTALVQASQDLAERIGHGYVLGENSLAHCTIAQIHATDARDVWHRIATLRDARLTLKLADPYVARVGGITWFGMNVTPSRSLQRLHERVLALLDLPDTAYQNRIREGFTPHFTLGADLSGGNATAEPSRYHGPRRIACRLHLGESGSQYQFAKTLFPQ